MNRLLAACLLAGVLPALAVTATPTAAQRSVTVIRPSYTPPPYRAPTYTPPRVYSPPPRPVTVTPQRTYTPPPRITQTAPVTRPVPSYKQPSQPRVTIRPAAPTTAARKPTVSVPKTADQPRRFVTSQPGHYDGRGRARYDGPRMAHYGTYHWPTLTMSPTRWPMYYGSAPYTMDHYDQEVRRCINDMMDRGSRPTELRKRQCRRILTDAGLMR